MNLKFTFSLKEKKKINEQKCALTGTNFEDIPKSQ